MALWPREMAVPSERCGLAASPASSPRLAACRHSALWRCAPTRSWLRLPAASLVVVLSLASLPLSEAAKKGPPPVAVEAGFKERITKKLEDSLTRAANQLAWTLGASGSASEGSSTIGGPFGRYELDLGSADESSAGVWRARCESDIDTTRDSITMCAMHKLQALTALCDAPGAAEAHGKGIAALLKALTRTQKKAVQGLGVKRAKLPIGNSGPEGWLVETTPGSDNYDINIAAHAAAMLAVVRCGKALGDKEMLTSAETWFTAVNKAYPRSYWDKQSFHLNSILWEMLEIVSSSVRTDSSFFEELQDFIKDLGSYLQKDFTKDEKVWSFSGANAAVLSWQAETKASQKKARGKLVDEYIKRFRVIVPSLNVSETYTCGPLQGFMPLLLRRGDDAAELVSFALKMAEKDVDLFQVGLIESSAAAKRVGPAALTAQGGKLEGAFIRDERQMEGERRRSIRIDDTAQCVIALTRTLHLLDDLIGVEVPDNAAEADASAQASGDKAAEL